MEALTYDAPAPVAHPIADYITLHQTARGALDFDRSIFDLAVHEDRLYFGYGDATNNLGTVRAIEIRSLSAPDASPLREATTGEDHGNVREEVHH